MQSMTIYSNEHSSIKGAKWIIGNDLNGLLTLNQ